MFATLSRREGAPPTRCGSSAKLLGTPRPRRHVARVRPRVRRPRPPRRAIVFLVSDFLCRGWERPLTTCAKRHDVVAVRIRVPELAPPDAGLLRVRDPETGVATVVDWRSPRVRAEYSRRVAAWQAETEQSLRRAKVDLMDVPVPRVPERNAIAGPILRFFRMCELRGAKK